MLLQGSELSAFPGFRFWVSLSHTWVALHSPKAEKPGGAGGKNQKEVKWPHGMT